MPRLARVTRRSATLAAVALVLAVSTATAAEYLSGDTVRVHAGETIEGDLYAAGQSVIINGTVRGDVVAAAASVVINGDVRGSVNAAGASVTVDGSVRGSVRAAARDVAVAGRVGGDLVAYAQSLTLGQEGRVNGDVAGGIGALDVDGTVQGDVVAAAGQVDIDGVVRGEVSMQVDHLRVGPTAEIAGDVRYASQTDGELSAVATVGGVVQRTAPREGPSYLPEHPIVQFLGLSLGLFLIGAVILLIRPAPGVSIGEQLRTRPLLAAGAGLATWLAQFLALGFLVIVGLLLAQLAASFGAAVLFLTLILVFTAAVLAMAAQAFVAMAIARVVADLWALSTWSAYAVSAVALAALLTIAALVSGALAVLLHLTFWVLGLGAFVLYQGRRRQVEAQALLALRPTGPGIARFGFRIPGFFSGSHELADAPTPSAYAAGSGGTSHGGAPGGLPAAASIGRDGGADAAVADRAESPRTRRS